VSRDRDSPHVKPQEDPTSTSDVAGILAEVAAEHPRVGRHDARSGASWAVGGTTFAAVDGAVAEFRLRPDMVGAALRTPGTRTSERGPEWIVFEAPDEPERYDVDRLRSWFEMAARLAGG